MIDLDAALTDLAEHLDVPADGAGPADLVRRLTAPVPMRRRGRVPALVAGAAAIAVVAAGVLVVSPARHAVAGWLGVGAVEVHQSAPPTSGAPSSTTRPPVRSMDLATARGRVQFDIITPIGAAPPSRITVDRRVPGGLVALAYDHFTLVEIATDPDEPTIAKFVRGGRVEEVAVHGHDGLWIPRAHSIGYIDRSGGYRISAVRRSGPVLTWAVDDVTFRVEGPRTLAEALAIADTVR